jgi:hypothetical protein
MYPEYHNDMIIIFKILPKKKKQTPEKEIQTYLCFREYGDI